MFTEDDIMRAVQSRDANSDRFTKSVAEPHFQLLDLATPLNSILTDHEIRTYLRPSSRFDEVQP